MTNHVKFYLTEQGRNKAVRAEQMQLTVQLQGLAFGKGKYNAQQNANGMTELRQPIEHNLGQIPFQSSHLSDDGVLNLQTLVDSDTFIEVYEIGVMDSDGDLFAVASSESEHLFAFLRNSSVIFFMAITFADVSQEQIVINLSGETSLTLSLFNQVERMKYRVGDIYETTIDFPDGHAVAKRMGYGTWEPFAEGRVTAGKAREDDENAPAWLKQMGGTGGDYGVKALDLMTGWESTTSNGTGRWNERGNVVMTSSHQEQKEHLESLSHIDRDPSNRVISTIQPTIAVGRWIRTA